MFDHKLRMPALLAGSALVVTVLGAGMAPASSASGSIVFYEGNGGSQDIVHTLDDAAGQNVRPATNDEARSVVLHGVRAGVVISVFDDPKAKKSDDYCVITVKKSSPEYTVRTFQRSYEDEYVHVAYIKKNGLDGKVSRIRVD